MSEGKKRFLRLSAGGVASSVVDVLTLLLLVELAGVHVTAAAFLASGTGAISSFCVNKFWAFRDRSPVHLNQVASFALVAAASAVLLASAVHVLAVWFHVPYLCAKALGAASVFLFWSYPAQARFVFCSTPSASSSLA